MSKIFLHAEVQASIPFSHVPWQRIHPEMKKQPGLIRKAWLSGVSTQTVNGIYEFSSKETALEFSLGMLAEECHKAQVTANIKLFDLDATKEASLDMGSPYFQ